jgi:hypothetical protein
VAAGFNLQSKLRSSAPRKPETRPPRRHPSPPLPEHDDDDDARADSMTDYKASKEDFVSGTTGSSIAHINIISTVALV